MLLLTGIS